MVGGACRGKMSPQAEVCRRAWSHEIIATEMRSNIRDRKVTVQDDKSTSEETRGADFLPSAEASRTASLTPSRHGLRC
jgi:hypothetical protein